jgi:hypothetical protein
MNIDINSIVRSVAVVVVGLPLALSSSSLINSAASAARNAQGSAVALEVKQEYAGQIAKACYGYALSKNDSKLERESKTAIDEVFGGEVNYQQVCNALIF